jgi:hypothetical protein
MPAARDLTQLELVDRLVALLREDKERRKLIRLMVMCGQNDVSELAATLERWRRRKIQPLMNEYERRRG